MGGIHNIYSINLAFKRATDAYECPWLSFPAIRAGSQSYQLGLMIIGVALSTAELLTAIMVENRWDLLN